MHIHECLEMSFPLVFATAPSSVDAENWTSTNDDPAANNASSSLDNAAPSATTTMSAPTTSHEPSDAGVADDGDHFNAEIDGEGLAMGAVWSGIPTFVNCVLVDWALKTKTDFYLPTNHPSRLDLDVDGSTGGSSDVYDLVAVSSEYYVCQNTGREVPPLFLPWYFGALCWTFTLGGMAMLLLEPEWIRTGGGGGRRHWFPYRMFAWTLILVQGPSSFAADYLKMADVSYWHAFDRVVASASMSLEIVKICVMRNHLRPRLYASYLTSACAALACFAISQKAQNRLDGEGFVFWHGLWHCQPLAAIAIMAYSKYLDVCFGDYVPLPRNGGRGEGGGKLLSTAVMELLDPRSGKEKNTDQERWGKKKSRREPEMQFKMTRKVGPVDNIAGG